MTTSPQRDPLPKALSQAELDALYAHLTVGDFPVRTAEAITLYRRELLRVVQQIHTLQAQLEQAQRERDTAVKVAKSLGQTKESLEDEIAAIKNLNIDLQRERDDLVAEIDVKRRRNEELYRELTTSREQVKVLTRYAKHYPTCFKTSKALEHNDCNCGLQQALQAERKQAHE